MSEEEPLPQAWFADARGRFHMVDPFRVRVLEQGVVRWDAPVPKTFGGVVGSTPFPPPVPVLLRRGVFQWYGAEVFIYVEDGESEALGAVALFALAFHAAILCFVFARRDQMIARMERDHIDIVRLCEQARARLRS